MMRFLIVCVALLLSIHAFADNWPQRTIKLTVAFGAGGTTDASARYLATLLEKDLGKTIAVINRPGGGGSVAAALTKAKKPDGYQLFTVATGASVLSPHILDLPYDPLTDFTFIAQYASWNFGLVVPSDAPYETLEELLAYSKQNNTNLSYAIGGAGTPAHLAMEHLKQLENISHWHAVPHNGGAAAVTALLGGHVDMMAGSTEWLPQVKSGEFKLLAIISDKRMDEFPDIATLQELGYPITAPSLLGIAGPAGMSDAIVRRLDKSIKNALANEEMQALLKRLGMQNNYKSNTEFTQYIHQQYQTQGQVINTMGLTK